MALSASDINTLGSSTTSGEEGVVGIVDVVGVADGRVGDADGAGEGSVEGGCELGGCVGAAGVAGGGSNGWLTTTLTCASAGFCSDFVYKPDAAM